MYQSTNICMHKSKFRNKKWMTSVGIYLLISIPLLASKKSVAQSEPEAAARKVTSNLAAGWVGIIKIVPTDLSPIKKFNIQMKLSNHRIDLVRIGSADAYDVLVNIAPEGMPLVRSNFSAQIITATPSGWFPNIKPVINNFDIVEKKSNASFLGVCTTNMTIDNVSVLSNGSWKGDVICWHGGTEKNSGTITLRRGQFDETAKSVGTVTSGGGNNSNSSNNRTQSSESPNNSTGINEIKDRVPGLLRRIFR